MAKFVILVREIIKADSIKVAGGPEQFRSTCALHLHFAPICSRGEATPKKQATDSSPHMRIAAATVLESDRFASRTSSVTASVEFADAQAS